MIRRNHKDRLFVKLFGDPENKENLLSLYNALNDRNYDDPDELEINTISSPARIFDTARRSDTEIAQL